MELTLKRTDFTDKSTIGELYVDGQFECFILEDVVRKGQKVYGETAIPYGRYKVEITHSPRFGRKLPLLLDVPNFTGIRIHVGNSPRDTDGCLLPGSRKGTDFVYESSKAFGSLYKKLEQTKEPVYITIE